MWCVFYFGQFYIELVDDLNFQVGMAHFSEEQHECILNSLGAMFCYRNKKVHTCIIYVVNTPCRPNEVSKKNRCLYHLLILKGILFLLNYSLSWWLQDFWPYQLAPIIDLANNRQCLHVAWFGGFLYCCLEFYTTRPFWEKNLPNIFFALFIALQYLDYVMKVMLPEALIKLYQDIHKTSFEEVS